MPLPVRVIARALDVTDDRIEDFKRWSDASVAAIGSDLTDDEVIEDYGELLELSAFVAGQIERKRGAGPAPDIMSQLVHAELDDQEAAELGGPARRQLSDDEIQSIVRQLLVAGNETTSNLLTQLIVQFGVEPEWWERMRAEPALIPAVVEEGLRYFSPSAVNQRVARCPVDAGRRHHPAGRRRAGLLPGGRSRPRGVPGSGAVRPDPAQPRRAPGLRAGHPLLPGSVAGPDGGADRARRADGRGRLLRTADADDLPWNKSFQLRAIKTLPFRPRLRAVTA